MADRADSVINTASEGLDLYAAAWLEKWASAGGDVFLLPDGKLQIGFPVFDGSPLYSEMDEQNRQGSSWQLQNYMFSDGAYHGRMRVMQEMLDTVPGGREAVRNHMRSHGLCQYYTGRAAKL